MLTVNLCTDFYSALSLLVDELVELPDCDNIKLARYCRCVFQVLMGIDTELALKELRSISHMAKRAFEVSVFDKRAMLYQQHGGAVKY